MKYKLQNKVYIVRKYVLAQNAQEAIRKERNQKVDDCYAEEKSVNNFIETITPKVENYYGFKK